MPDELPPDEPPEAISTTLYRVLRALLSSVAAVLAVLVAIAFLLAVLGLALSIVAGLAWAIYKAFPDPIPQKTNAGWVDLIFSNQYVVFSARIVLISLALVLLIGGVYITMSMFVRIYRREWLHKAGPFEAKVAERVDEDLETVDDTYQEMLNEAWGENVELARRLEESLADLENVTDQRDRLLEAIERSPGGTSP
jgi:hypothetical protein